MVNIEGEVAMSVSASLEIKLSHRLGQQISPLNIVELLRRFGWSFRLEGRVSYLPVGDIDDFNWTNEALSDDALLSVLQQKEITGEIIGVAMTWRDTEIGGQFLFARQSTVSINLNINRIVLASCAPLTDVSWYISRLAPAFSSCDIILEALEYYEHV